MTDGSTNGAQVDSENVEIGQAQKNTNMSGLSKKYFAINSVTQLLFFAFNAITSIIMIPYLIHHLGTSAYGVITLANKVVGWTQFLATAVVSMIGRFVLIHLSRGETSTARRYFSTQFIATIALVILLLPVVILISYLSPALFKISGTLASVSRIVFLLTYVSFLLMMIYSALQTSIYVRQQFYIRDLLDTLNQTFRYASWIVLFTVMSPALWHVGVGYAVGALIAVIGVLLAFRKLTPELTPSLKIFDVSKFKEMTNFGGWMVAGQIGLMLYNRSDAAILSWSLGLASVGMYGAVAGFTDMVANFTSSYTGMIGPSVIASYGRADYDGCFRIIKRAMKFLSCGMGVLMGVLAGLAEPLLIRWLGTEFGSLSIVVWLLFASIAINSPTDPMATLLNAAKKVNVLAYSNIGGGILNVVLAILLLKFTRLGLCSMPIALALSSAVKNLIVFPYYSGKVLHKPVIEFYKPQMPSIGVVLVSFTLTMWVAKLMMPKSFLSLTCVALPLFCVLGAAAYFLVLDNDDRRFCREVLPFSKKRVV